MIVVLVTSCDLLGKIDDIEPQYKLTDETVMTDLKSAESTLNGVYASWSNIRIGWMRHYLDAITGVEGDKNILGMEGFSKNQVDITNEGVAYNYEALYNVVNNATSFIYNLAQKPNLKGVSPERRAEMTAEAKCMRAMAYLYLLRQYGEFYNLGSTYGIVLYGDEPVRDNISMKRSSVADVYETINDDLDDAILHAPEFTEHYLISRLVAKALKARVMLYMKDYPKAGSLAQEVIDEAEDYGYALEEDYLDIFTNSFYSSEVLYALYSTYPDEKYGGGQWNTSTAGKNTTLIADEIGEGEKDKRFVKIYSEIDPDKKYVKNNKYPFSSYEFMQDTHYYVRLAEMYYIVAEAEARQQHFDLARMALKGIICLERAGYSEDYVDGIADNNMLEMILKHKWIELCTENNEEWYDLIRYHVEDGFVIVPTYVASDIHLTLPIPKDAMAGNNLLEQNPSYNN